MGLKRIANATVVITGASLGVGAAVTRLFFSGGANVVLLARGKEALDQLAGELGDESRVMTAAVDVMDTPEIAAVLTAVKARFGSIDVLVNNAGFHQRGPALQVDAEAMAKMVDVNLRAPIVLARMVLPDMVKAGQGAIINVASLAGRTPVPGSAVYSATKFGLRAFTLAVAEECRGTGVKVASVSPGPIDTGFIMSDIDQVSDLTFSQPISTADEVAEQILALCSNDVLDQPMPRMSGVLTTMSYLFPGLGRALRPMLERKGRRTKERLKAAKS